MMSELVYSRQHVGVTDGGRRFPALMKPNISLFYPIIINKAQQEARWWQQHHAEVRLLCRSSWKGSEGTHSDMRPQTSWMQ